MDHIVIIIASLRVSTKPTANFLHHHKPANGEHLAYFRAFMTKFVGTLNNVRSSTLSDLEAECSCTADIPIRLRTPAPVPDSCTTTYTTPGQIYHAGSILLVASPVRLHQVLPSAP